MVDNRGVVDDGSRGIGRGNGGRGLGEDCLALVGDGCVVALGPGSVGDDLDSAVGKVDAVLAASVGSVPLLGLREDRVAVALVVHSILVVVNGRQIGVGFNWDRSSNRVLWPTGGKSKQGCKEHQLGHGVGERVCSGGKGLKVYSH